MMQLLEKLRRWIEVIIVPTLFHGDSLDAYLDDREITAFDSDWVNADKLVERYILQRGLTDEIKSKIDLIRQEAYIRAFNITGDPDCAGYISDDFGLIASALVLGVEDDWINALCERSKSGCFPHGELERIGGTLSDLID